MKRGRPVVAADWLSESALAGRPLPPERFFPPGPVPSAPGGDGAPGGTQMMPSQLTQTQVGRQGGCAWQRGLAVGGAAGGPPSDAGPGHMLDQL
jgi:hypothetical protein